MHLRQAIQRVVKVIPRKKELQANYGFVRFVAGNNGDRPWIYATDGQRIFSAMVDADLPTAVLESKLLAKAAKDPGNMILSNHGYGRIDLQTEHNRYSFQSGDPDGFLPPPVYPKKEQCQLIPDIVWQEIVPPVVHAAATEKEDFELSVVRFTKDFVEASDKNRLARVEIAKDWEGLVSADLFKSWPKGDVHFLFRDNRAYFWVGDEMRFAPLLMHRYIDTDRMIPKTHPGPFVLVPTDALTVAVKQGTVVSKLGLVNLEIGSDKIVLRAWEGQADETYEATIPIYHGCGQGGGRALVNGKYLVQALGPVKTPNVRLGYGHVTDPLRLESRSYIACVWQIFY